MATRNTRKAAQTVQGDITAQKIAEFQALSPDNQLAVARYYGRAIARLIHAKFEFDDETGDTLQPGADGVVYRVNSQKCECQEFHDNLAADLAAKQGMKPARNPGLQDKHTLLHMAVKDGLDLYKVVHSMPEELQDAANEAMNTEIGWATGRKTARRSRRDGAYQPKDVPVVQAVVKKDRQYRGTYITGDDGFAHKQFTWGIPDGMDPRVAVAKVSAMFPGKQRNAVDIMATKVTTEFYNSKNVQPLS